MLETYIGGYTPGRRGRGVGKTGVAELMKRVVVIDILECPRCRGPMRILTTIRCARQRWRLASCERRQPLVSKVRWLSATTVRYLGSS